MWLRSDIEKITGLSKRKIQELCHQNKRTGGIAFWNPAESKPGYSRFDENDLAVFYFVEKLYESGFYLREMGEALRRTDISNENQIGMQFDQKALTIGLETKRNELLKERQTVQNKLNCINQIRLSCSKFQGFSFGFYIYRNLLVAIKDAISSVNVNSNVRFNTDFEISNQETEQVSEHQNGPDAYEAEKRLIDQFCNTVIWFMTHSLAPDSEEVKDFYSRVARYVLSSLKEEYVFQIVRELLSNKDVVFTIEMLCGKGSSCYIRKGIDACLNSES